MTSASLQTTSRMWSCSTLNDGIDHLLMEANKIESEEEQLEKWIKDPCRFFVHVFTLVWSQHDNVWKTYEQTLFGS